MHIVYSRTFHPVERSVQGPATNHRFGDFTFEPQLLIMSDTTFSLEPELLIGSNTLSLLSRAAPVVHHVEIPFSPSSRSCSSCRISLSKLSE